MTRRALIETGIAAAASTAAASTAAASATTATTTAATAASSSAAAATTTAAIAAAPAHPNAPAVLAIAVAAGLHLGDDVGVVLLGERSMCVAKDLVLALDVQAMLLGQSFGDLE